MFFTGVTSEVTERILVLIKRFLESSEKLSFIELLYLEKDIHGLYYITDSKALENELKPIFNEVHELIRQRIEKGFTNINIASLPLTQTTLENISYDTLKVNGLDDESIIFGLQKRRKDHYKADRINLSDVDIEYQDLDKIN